MFISIFIIIFFSPTILNSTTLNSNENLSNNLLPSFNSDTLIWPIPGYTRLSSRFGHRTAPTTFASSFHKGIDVPATPGTNLIAAISGTIITANFSGSGGCTVSIKNGNIIISYCHVSPNFIVCIGQKVKEGDIIAQVGPKNVYGFSENKYRDNNGNPTNGATTGPHLHFAIKENNKYIDPMIFFE